MRIVDRKFVDKTYTRELANTSGWEKKPHVMQVVRMYPRLTISNLTEGLRTCTLIRSLKGSLRQSTLMQSMENRCELH
jgi:hypothetical protein